MHNIKKILHMHTKIPIVQFSMRVME